MSTDLKKQNAKITEKKKVLSDSDKKIRIANLQAFKDYKLSRSQLRQLADILEVPEESNALTDNKNPPEKVSNKKKKVGSIASKNRHFLKTIVEVDELNCSSSFSKETESKEKVLHKLNLRPVVMLYDVNKISFECATTGLHEDKSIIGVVNKDEKGILALVASTNNEDVKPPVADVVNKMHNEMGNGLENEIHLALDTNQFFKCVLCNEKNSDIPWNEILVHRWEHYKGLMSYNQYIAGHTEYPSWFKRP